MVHDMMAPGAEDQQRVLVVDDDEDLAESIADLLEFNGFTVALAHNSAQALEKLDEFAAQVALVDLRLGLENGLDVLEQLKKKRPELIAIVVTANTDRESLTGALERQAYDYLTKPVDSNWLAHVVSRAFYVVRLNQENFNMIRELKTAKEEAEKLALSDFLTNLANRYAFHARLEEVIAQADRTKKLAGLMLIDLDGFKEINDTYGHQTGDYVLKKIALRLNASLEPADVVGRLGGDEFAVIISNLNTAEDIWPKVTKIQECFQDPIMFDNIALAVDGSIGVSICPDDANTAEELIRRADVALYTSKAEGRGFSNRFDRDMDKEAREKYKLHNDLCTALSNQEFELYYQPKINLENSQIAGAEALLRWNHTELGLVAPNKFIEAAESSGLIVDIGKWVIETACRQMKNWRNSSLSDIHIAVNLSMRQLLDGTLVNTIHNVLQELNLAPSMLELELTEGIVNADENHINQQLCHLRKMGIKIALDDFGTGYSSLTRLKNHPIDYLKIDQSFVHDLISNAEDRFICTAAIQLAKNLGLKTIVEGIETSDQKDFFQAIGCDEAQGFYFSKPVPAREFEEWALNYSKGWGQDRNKRTVA